MTIRPLDLDPRAIVVRLPNWLGDAIMATVALRALRGRFPDATITVLGRPLHERLLRGLTTYDAFIPLDSKKGLRSLVRQGRALRAHAFDLGVLLPNSLSSALIFAVARIPERVGYALNKRSWLLTRKLRPEMAGHRRVPTPMTDYYGKLLEVIGVPMRPRRPELAVLPDEEAALDAFLRESPLPPGDGPLVLLNPGASFGTSKLWTAEGFAAVGDRLHASRGARIVVLAGPGEEALAAAIGARMSVPHLAMGDRFLPLGALKALVARCDAMVTTDAGPRHVAVAFDRPVVVLFGSTDPRYTNANLDRSVLIRREDVPCSPCHLKVCPIDHRCMTWIPPGDVVAGVERLLDASRA